MVNFLDRYKLTKLNQDLTNSLNISKSLITKKQLLKVSQTTITTKSPESNGHIEFNQTFKGELTLILSNHS